MSIRVMTAVWESSKAEGTDLLVLLALADMANDDGECWPSMTTIAKRSRLEPRNARKRIRALEDLGEVVVIANGGRASSKGGLRSNRYRVVVHLDSDDSPSTLTRPSVSEDHDPGASVPIEVIHTRTDASVSHFADPDASIPQTLTPASPLILTPASAESSVEPSVNHHHHAGVVDKSLALIVRCRMRTMTGIKNPAAYERAVTTTVRAELLERANHLIAIDPGLTYEALAYALEPTTVPRPPASPEVLERQAYDFGRLRAHLKEDELESECRTHELTGEVREAAFDGWRAERAEPAVVAS